MSNALESTIYIISFLWIVISCVGLYFLLPKKIKFNWKKNLIVFFVGLTIISITVYLMTLFDSNLIVILIGSFLVGPWLGYFWAAIKTYLQSKK